MHTSSTSCVIGTDGIRSVSTLESRMTRQEYSVNRRPISLKLITAGIALSSRLMSVNGSAMPANRCALRWMSRGQPVKSSRKQAACVDKALDIGRHNDRCKYNQQQPAAGVRRRMPPRGKRHCLPLFLLVPRHGIPLFPVVRCRVGFRPHYSIRGRVSQARPRLLLCKIFAVLPHLPRISPCIL